MEYQTWILWLLSIAAFICVTPIVVYVSLKLGTYAILKAKRSFNQQYPPSKGEFKNGNES